MSPTRHGRNRMQNSEERVLDRFIPCRRARARRPPILDEDDGEEVATRQCILDKVLYNPRTRAYRRHLELALFGGRPSSTPTSSSCSGWQHWPSRGRDEPLRRYPQRTMMLSGMPKGRRVLHQLLAWGACGALAVACRGDVYLWREGAGASGGEAEMLFSDGGVGDDVISLCWSSRPDEHLLVVGLTDRRVQMWDCHKRAPLSSRMLPDRAPAHTVSWHPSRNLVAFGTIPGNVHILSKQLVVVRSMSVFPEPMCGVSRIAFSPDGSLLACGSLAGYVVVWNWEQDKLRSDEVNTRSTVTSLSWHPWRRSMLAVGSLSGDILIMDFTMRSITEAKYKGRQGRRSEVSALSFSPKTGELVAAFSSGGTAQVTVLKDLTTVVDRLEEHEETVNYLSWSPDGTTLATAASDNKLCLWNFMGVKRSRALKREALQAAREARSGVARQFGCVIR